MDNLKELEKIYEANKKIELFCDGIDNPPMSGQYAKRLLLGCKRALKIVGKYETAYLETELREEIEDMEDELASRGRIFIITYNLGARVKIHIIIECIKDGTISEKQ